VECNITDGGAGLPARRIGSTPQMIVISSERDQIHRNKESDTGRSTQSANGKRSLTDVAVRRDRHRDSSRQAKN